MERLELSTTHYLDADDIYRLLSCSQKNVYNMINHDQLVTCTIKNPETNKDKAYVLEKHLIQFVIERMIIHMEDKGCGLCKAFSSTPSYNPTHLRDSPLKKVS